MLCISESVLYQALPDVLQGLYSRQSCDMLFKQDAQKPCQFVILSCVSFMCCDSCAHSDSEACQTSSEEEDSSWPLEVSDLWAVPDPWRRSDAVSGVHHAHVSDAPSVSEDQLCVSVLLREESLKGKTKREMCPSPLCRWQKRVWCWTTSRSSKPVAGIKTLKHTRLCGSV